MDHLEALVELASLIVQVGQVENWLEEVIRCFLCLDKVVFRLLNICLAKFEHAQIVERFGMLRVEADGDLVGLIGQA